MSLSAGVDAFVKDSRGGILDIHSMVFTELSREIIMATPVGNVDLWDIPESQKAAIKASGYKGGRLRGNWYAGANKKPKKVTKQIDPEGSKTVEAARAKSKNLHKTKGSILYLRNIVPYGTKIELGNPKWQAPNGMLRVNTTGSHMRSVVRKAVRNRV